MRPRAQLLHTITEILLANVGVTTDALIFLLEDLAAHPAAQTRARNEILALRQQLAAGAASTASASADADAGRMSAEFAGALLSRCRFLYACVLESARLRPTIPVTFPERACRDAQLGSLFVPKHVSARTGDASHRVRRHARSCLARPPHPRSAAPCAPALTAAGLDARATDRGVR